MKKLLILTLVIATFTSCQRKNVWTKDYEKQTYDTMYTELGSIMKDSAQRKDFCKFIVSKLKTKLPYGIESVSGDSLSKLSRKIAIEYEASHKTQDFQAVIPWSQEAEVSLRNSMQVRLGDKFTKKAKDKYCDCVITLLKRMYPDSLATPLSDSTTTILNNTCISALVKK